jgi:hypothetical protein
MDDTTDRYRGDCPYYGVRIRVRVRVKIRIRVMGEGDNVTLGTSCHD